MCIACHCEKQIDKNSACHPSTNQARPFLASETGEIGRVQGGMAVDKNSI